MIFERSTSVKVSLSFAKRLHLEGIFLSGISIAYTNSQTPFNFLIFMKQYDASR